jgi:N-acetylmuramoyl-L-alanine amidase
MRNYIIIFFLFFGLIPTIYGQETRTNKLTKIVIDPGHGGDKPGAKGKRSLEKDINLAVALKLGEIINDNLKTVKVIYTRTTDVDVDLFKRSQLANREKADLFISIHCNASPSHDAYGTETFVMGLAKSEANLAAAKKENADILTEANYKETYDGFDPNSPESNIFFSLYQNAYLDQSLSLADKIQKQFTSNTKLFNRGVKQAPYLVLYKTSVPCILTEIGFISNAKEEAFLNTEKGQYEIAASIFRAICEYKMKKEGVHFNLPSVESLIPKEAIHKDEEQRRKEREERHIAAEKIKEEENQEIRHGKTAQNTSQDEVISSNSQEKEVDYRVQFYSSPTKVSETDPDFKGLEDIWIYNDSNIWKYTSGKFKDFKTANKYKNSLKEKYKDAFVVIFYKNERITLEKAKQIERQIKK